MVTYIGQQKASGTAQGGGKKSVPDLHKTLILAAEAAGEDGRGRGGLVGYFRRWALTHPKSFVRLLDRVMPYMPEPAEEPAADEWKNMTLQEASDRYQRLLKNDEARGRAEQKAARERQSLRRVKGAPKQAIPPLPGALILAAESVGENGRGRNGLVGYLKRWAVTDLGSFARMLGPILPELQREPDPASARMKLSPEEAAAAYGASLRENSGE
jgi:hypothetical protein